MAGVTASVAVADTIVAVGNKVCPAGGTVHTGVGCALAIAPQAEFKNITANAPTRIWREILLISQTSSIKVIDLNAGFPLK